MSDSMYLEFTDDASRHPWNLASIAWVIHYPLGQLLIESAYWSFFYTIAKYSVIINLLSKEISYSIESLVVYLDLQLLVFQLNIFLS